jgi:thioesterase DpgC
MTAAPDSSLACLTAAGLPGGDVEAWSQPSAASDFAGDSRAFSAFWRGGAALLARLPVKPKRNSAEQAAAELIKQRARQARVHFLQAHAEALYDSLTGNRSRFLRVDELMAAAASAVSGLVPQDIEAGVALRDKEGAEVDQGLFLSAILASQRCGNHLCHAMLLPRREAFALLPQFAERQRIDFDTASIERQGGAVTLTMRNPRYLNAEDQTTIDAMEIGVDLALLDRASAVAVLRGAPEDQPK